ncbi:MAG: hypothetical protein AVO39_01640 [delta proteobacterium MLS_D]|jgi:heterodisulfide reductase subunit A2|nr:MAG: hypothetical protein AVO39_01640 [delta proteobacterium MLS_D]
MMTGKESQNPVIVAGGGVAGLTAALDLAAAGRYVELVESAEHLGGRVSELDKIYPGDHCAFCPLWTDIRRVEDHENIRVRLTSRITAVERKPDSIRVTITTEPRYIDESLCVFCGRCREACAADAVRPSWEHASPPSFFIDKTGCTKCGDCVDQCPTGAIDIERPPVEIVLSADDIIWATGFEEVDLTPLPEFGYGTHPDIMTSLEFENWIAEAGVNQGRILRRSNGKEPRNIAFIQCAGARDRRLLPYCSGVCCMHALKQAQWIKRRAPEVGCTIFYTDLRTVGRDYFDYGLRSLRMTTGVDLVRGRPGMIRPLPGGDALALKYENTETQAVEIARFDVVILNGNLAPSQLLPGSEADSPVDLDSQGFVSAGRDGAAPFACGFSREPADIAESVLRASSSAVTLAGRKDGPEP